MGVVKIVLIVVATLLALIFLGPAVAIFLVSGFGEVGKFIIVAVIFLGLKVIYETVKMFLPDRKPIRKM